MNGAELKTMCESILDDTVDDVLFYQLLNVAKNTVEDERPWMYLRALDSTKSSTTGTNLVLDLPDSWRRTYKLLVGPDTLFIQVPFDEQHLYRFSSNRFFIDVANEQYKLLGSLGSADTIYHYYIKATDDIEATTSPTMPSRFHALLAFVVAGYVMMGTDADDIYARMSPENKIMAQTVKVSMQSWDMQLQIDAQNGQIGVSPTETGIDLGNM